MDEININNFHCYFPGGGRRPGEWPGKEYPQKWVKLVKDLDSLIETESLDIEALKMERNLMFQLNKRAISVAYSNMEEGMRLAEESSKHSRKMDSMIIPFYERMLKLGYSHEDLIV